jgi:chromosome segregation ATPase
MDHAPNNEPTSPETSTTDGDEPSAAHFREAARLAAARVRAAMAGMPDEVEETDDRTPMTAPSAKAMETVARKRARSLAGMAPEETSTTESKSNKKSASKRINAANDKAATLLPEIDERLETGARMLRAFESQIERLERSARNAEEANAVSGTDVDQGALDKTAEAFEARFAMAQGKAEEATRGLETISSESKETAEALATGLETATTVKDLLETTIKELAEEAERRSNEVKTLLTRAEGALTTIDQQLQRAEVVEKAIKDGLERSEASARRIENLVNDRISRAQSNAEQVERASKAALGSVREHVARELAGISNALLQQSTGMIPTTTPAAAPTTLEAVKDEPPLIEVDMAQRPVNKPPASPPVTGQISHGTLSIDESTIRHLDQQH